MTAFTKKIEALIAGTNESNGAAVNYIISSYADLIKPKKKLTLVECFDQQLSKEDKKDLIEELTDIMDSKEEFNTRQTKTTSNQATLDERLMKAAHKVAENAELAFNTKYKSAADRQKNNFRINDFENSKAMRSYIYSDVDCIKELMALNMNSSKKFENSVRKWCEDNDLKCLGGDFNNANFYFKNDIYEDAFDRNLYMIHIGEYVELYIIGQTRMLDSIQNVGNKLKAVKFNSESLKTWRVQHLALIKRVIVEEYDLNWDLVIGKATNEYDMLRKAVDAAKDCDFAIDEIDTLTEKQCIEQASKVGLVTKSYDKAWDHLYNLMTVAYRDSKFVKPKAVLKVVKNTAKKEIKDTNVATQKAA